jgi:hypothetical protein
MYPQLEPVTFPSTLTATFNNNSNICMSCHQGRKSGSDVDAEIAECSGVGDCDAQCTPTGAGGAGGAGGASGCEGLGFLDVHYYAAAASLFGSDVGGGYEYVPGQGGAGGAPAYAGQNTFPAGVHNSLNDCVECHMTSSGDAVHTFLPEVSACSGCHSAGATDDFKVLEPALKDNYDDIQALEGELLAEIVDYADVTLGAPICYSLEYPYWCDDTGGECACSPAPGGGAYAFDAVLLKGAYNYQVSHKEPCGYIHNGAYIKQLLFDSITDLGGTPSVTRP